MNHVTEEQLILYYYGEAGDDGVEQHLDACAECRVSYAGLTRLLNSVDTIPVPERPGDYGEQVWERLRPRLRLGVPRWMAPLAVAAMIVLAFLAGRYSPRRSQPVRPVETVYAIPGQVRERILLVAVGEHLDRSQAVLIELANATARGPLDISGEQERAEDLVSENRLYRQTAASAGDARVLNVLDDLERVLLDIVHSPSQLDRASLDQLRSRIAADGILFKVRVAGSNIRQREESALKGL